MSFPTIDLSGLMGCAALPMQVDGINWSQSPLIAGDIGRIGTSVSAQVMGFISSADLDTLQSSVAALQTVSLISGTSITILGSSASTLVSLDAGECYEGGPHIAFELLDADSAQGYRRVRANITAKIRRATLLTNYQTRIQTQIDGLLHVEQAGTLIGASAPGAFPALLTAFQAAYPAVGWLVTYEVASPTGAQQPADGPSTTLSDLKTTFRISAVQLASPLPGTAAQVVDGTMTQRTDTDEQHRKTIVTDYSLHLNASAGAGYTALVASLRPENGSAGSIQLISESVRFSSIREFRLECSFTQLDSADGDGLLQYTQTVAATTADIAYETYTYPGIAPIAVSRPLVFAKISQSGSLTGLGEFIQPPPPLSEAFENQPQFTFTDVSDAQKKTDWHYDLLDLTGALTADITTLLAGIARSDLAVST